MRRPKRGQSQIVHFDIEDVPSFSGRHVSFEALPSQDAAATSGLQAVAGSYLHHRSRGGEGKRKAPIFEIAENCCTKKGPSVKQLLLRRPLAVLALIPKPAVLFTAGAVAGAIGTGSWPHLT